MQGSDHNTNDASGPHEVLRKNLEEIDEYLAVRNIAISNRPLAAVHMLATNGAITARDGSPVSSEPQEIVEAKWFPVVMKWVVAWYQLQYKRAAEPDREEPLIGYVLIRRTPFLIRIPRHIIEAGDQRDTVWLRLADRVLDEENALNWVPDVPATSNPAHIKTWNTEATSVAADLRFIHNRVLSLPVGAKADLRALSGLILPHFAQAALMVTGHDFRDLIRSYWELQMAAEAAFKSLLLQKTGTFPQIHDLIELADRVAATGMLFSTQSLRKFPHWKKVADMRYGRGKAPKWETCYRDYRSILSTVRQCATHWKCLGLSNASFLLQKPFWI
jgi:hypothetical protein